LISSELKKTLLKLLEEDEEFRYAVAGRIGLLEILKRFEALSEEQIKLREDFKELREDFKELREEQIKLREDFNKMLTVIKSMDERLIRVERTLEKLTLDIEEEAREVIEDRLSKMGINLKLGRVELPGLELNLYGAVEDICVIGDVSVRLGVNGVKKLVKAVNKLVEERSDLLRPRKILVLYTSLATEEALREAEKKGVWVLKATGDLTKPPL